MKDGERKASARKKSKGQEHIVKLIKSVFDCVGNTDFAVYYG